MNLEELTSFIVKKVGTDCGLNAKVRFAFEDGDGIFVDAKQVPNVVSNDTVEAADCTVKVSKANFKSVIEGNLNPMTAVMFGKIKIEGNMAIAMNISKIL